jgi:hypothetical protein
MEVAIERAFSADRTLVITRSPKLLAIGMTTLARPLAPACIRRVSPGFAWPSINRFR